LLLRHFSYLSPMRQLASKCTDFLAFAIQYARLGFRVFPLKERSKEPLIADWPNRASSDEAQIQEWWRRWPRANIGIATGEYGGGYFCVLDFDPRNGGDWFADAPREELPPTCIVHTGGGGRHYYYRTPYLLRSSKVGGGVDLKGGGGYVVAPPSVHPNGEVYVWEEGAGLGEVEMADLPRWCVHDSPLWRKPPPIPIGMRHNYLASLAGVLWGAGVGERGVEAILRRVVGLLEPGGDFDPDREIGGIVASLSRWEGDKMDLGAVLRALPPDVREIVSALSLIHI